MLSDAAEGGISRFIWLRQFGPFATQTIPASVSAAPYIPDGLLMYEAGRKIKEQYTDTGDFTDHVFAVTALLGFQFMLRIGRNPGLHHAAIGGFKTTRILTGSRSATPKG